jgi:putative sterol carrier protein
MAEATEQGGPAFDPSAVDAAAMDPVEFANMVRTASDELLLEALAAGREMILDEIFKRMEEHFDPQKAAGVEAVVDWKITGREDGGHDRYQAVIRGGACKVARDGGEAPRITFEVPAPSFMRLASGNALGAALYLSGQLRIEGDLALALTMENLFLIPAPSAS